MKLQKVGDSLGFEIPADALSLFDLAEGDELMLTLTLSGFRLEVSDEQISEQVNAGRNMAIRYRATLGDLSK